MRKLDTIPPLKSPDDSDGDIEEDLDGVFCNAAYPPVTHQPDCPMSISAGAGPNPSPDITPIFPAQGVETKEKL